MAKQQSKHQLQKRPPMNSVPPREEENDHDEEEEAPIKVEASSDICVALLQRYQKSPASQHRHLCASAAAIRSILLEEGFPLTPPAYLAAAISSLENSTSLDPEATSAISSFLSVLLPHVPTESLTPHKANEAAAVLARLLRGLPLTASAATLRSLVKTLGFVLPRCDVWDWDAVGLPLEILLRFSVDRRPKVRKCAQGFLEKVFMSFEPVICKKASKMVASMFEQNMPLAVELSATRISNGSKKELPSKLKHMEVIHLLNTLKIIFPFLSKKVAVMLLPDLSKLLGTHFSALTRHILNILGVFFELRDIPVSEVANIIVSLASYVTNGGDNPVDTVMSASTLLKSCLDKLQELDQSSWIRNLPLVFRIIAGLLSSQDDRPTQVMEILREMINIHIGSIVSHSSGSQLNYDELDTLESTAIESVCNVFVNLVSASGGISNEHLLAVISDLFLKLGGLSSFFTKDIILKLADQVSVISEQKQDMKHIQNCIGSAVISMGPDKILALLPITFNAKKLSCSNVWLIPIFKKYIVGASLYFFLDHIMPLATSIQDACSRVKKSPVVRNLQSCVHDLVDLLPSFCHYPTDISETVEPLVKLVAVLLKDPSKHEIVSTALQELIKQNKEVIKAKQDAKNGPMTPIKSTSLSNKEKKEELWNVPSHYSKKTASKNIRHLASRSMDLLQALTDAFFNSPPENRAKLKDAMGHLASITKSSSVKQLFVASLERMKSVGAASGHEKMESDIRVLFDMKQEENEKEAEKEEAHRWLMLEYASALIEGADEDFVNMVFDYIKNFLLACNGIGQPEVYDSLAKIFREHPWFYSVRFDEVTDMLFGLKSPVDVASLRSRFICFHFLLVHQLKNDLGKSNAKAFLILNEIILTLKSSNKETRKAAYDILLMISESLKGSENTEHLQRLFSMIIGYLSGASPHIMSGAVAALSLLIYKDPALCLVAPDLMPSILVLLKSKANEVIKAILGLMKVLVSSLHPKDLKEIISDLVNGILPWSSVSKHHFRLKVRIILEILTRKCGFDSVNFVTPEKYKSFIKNVAERKNKASAVVDSDETLEFAASLRKGPRGQKRVHDQSTAQVEMHSHAPRTQSWKVWKKPKTNTSSTASKGASATGQLSRSGNNIKRRNFYKKQQDGGNEMNKNRRKVMGNENVRASKNTASFKFHEKQQNRGVVKKKLRKGKGDDENVKRASKTKKFPPLKRGKARHIKKEKTQES